MNKETIKIGGMTCAACSQRVEKAIAKLEGIEKVSVNLATEKATLEYDPQVIRLSAIKDCIIKTGYQVLAADKNSVDEDRERKQKEIKTLWTKFIIASVFGIPLLYIAMVPMVSWWPFPIPRSINPMLYPLRFTLVQIILVTPIMIAGYRFYTVGFKSLIQRSPNMDSLVAIGTSSAILFSVYNTYQIIIGNFGAVDALYYETAGVIIALILLGKSLEAVSKGKTSEAIKKLMGLAPKTATIISNGKEIELPIEDVEIGDVILVRPGEKIPVDGVVLEGHTSIDEAMLTGESMPVDKKAGDKVFAASINKNGVIKFQAT